MTDETQKVTGQGCTPECNDGADRIIIRTDIASPCGVSMFALATSMAVWFWQSDPRVGHRMIGGMSPICLQCDDFCVLRRWQA